MNSQWKGELVKVIFLRYTRSFTIISFTVQILKLFFYSCGWRKVTPFHDDDVHWRAP